MGEPANIRALLDQPEPERRIGPFRLVEQLGRGGFAPVWLAKEIYGAAELRAAAVKLFSLHDGRDAGAKRRQIFEEARALCQVEHPNVVRFFALPIDEARGVVGLAMEHVAGTPLDKRLAGARRLEVAEVLEVAASVASALGAVHRAGLVHRDVKPANVIDARGLYKLIDFGIAAADAPESDAVPAASTRAAATAGGEPRPADRTTAPLGGRWGTTGYVDPVCVVAANPATPASDLYALGALLYECITGRLPAATRGPAAPLSVDVLEGHAAPPRVIDVAPDALPALASVVDRLLSPKRDDRPQSAEWIATRVAQLEVELRGGKRRLPDESDGPFRGLGRFEERDRGVYFGRSSEIAAALHVLRERGLAAVVGPSGSGKSSLARAGVAPLVAEGALGWPAAWDVAIASPGADPRASITLALAPFVSLPDASIDDAAAAASIAADLAARAQTKSRGLLLLVDQLEELATVAADRGAAAAGRDRAPFATELLGRIAEAPLPGLRALVTVRRDMLDPVLALGPFAREVVRGSVLIEPIGDLAWAEVLEQALGAYGYTFEDDSVKADVLEQLAATTDAMPLVQFALSELWRQRDAGAKRVTRAGLERLGGVAGALDRHAEATLAALDAPAAEATRAVILALTTPHGTRRAAADDELAALSPHAGAVVAAFEAARLVSRDDGGGATLAHEAILVQWGRLASWLAEARDDRLLHAELERDAERWAAEPDVVPLWPRRRLAGGEDLVRRGARLSGRGRSFLDAGRRAARRGLAIGGGSAAIALGSIAIATALYVIDGRDRLAKEQRDRAAAEQQTLEIRAKQAEIDRLLGALEDSRTKQKIVALQREIRGDVAPSEREPARAALALPRAPRGASAPPPTAPTSQPSPQPTTSAPPTFKVKEW